MLFHRQLNQELNQSTIFHSKRFDRHFRCCEKKCSLKNLQKIGGEGMPKLLNKIIHSASIDINLQTGWIICYCCYYEYIKFRDELIMFQGRKKVPIGFWSNASFAKIFLKTIMDHRTKPHSNKKTNFISVFHPFPFALYNILKSREMTALSPLPMLSRRIST